MQFITLMQSWIFSIITPVFSVTWSFRNHYNMMNCCSRNIYYYYYYQKCSAAFCETCDTFPILQDSLMNRNNLLYTEPIKGKNLGWVEKFWGGKKKYFSMFCVLSQKPVEFGLFYFTACSGSYSSVCFTMFIELYLNLDSNKEIQSVLQGMVLDILKHLMWFMFKQWLGWKADTIIRLILITLINYY